MLQHFEMSQCNSVKTPRPQKVQLFCPTEDDSLEIEDYLAAVGMLNFLVIQTRPDILFAVNYLARFNSQHNKSHWLAVKHLPRFVKGTLTTGLTFGNQKAQNKLVKGYADANYDGNVDTRWSTTGFVFYVKGSLVSWKSHQQNSVTLSTPEAEYLAIGDCAKHGLWLCRLLKHLLSLGNLSDPIHLLLLNDNQGVVILGNEASVNNKPKHIKIRHHLIRERVRDKKISVFHVSTKDMPAEILTKPVAAHLLDNCFVQLGLQRLQL